MTTHFTQDTSDRTTSTSKSRVFLQLRSGCRLPWQLSLQLTVC